MGRLTPWVQRLLVANVLVYLFVQPNTMLYRQGMFFGVEIFTHPWTLLTYQFLHGGFTHILFNMVGLYFFGPRIEQRLGGRKFLILYLGAGVFGAVLSAILTPGAFMVGASGAVYGVVAAFAVLWPFEKVYLWFVLPVPIWALATFAVVFSLQSGFGAVNDGVAHFAHLGGLVFGLAYLKLWQFRTGSAKREFRRKLETPSGSSPGILGDRAAMAKWETIEVEGLHELNRDEVQQLLDRARVAGPRSLTPTERQFLDRMAGT